MRQIYVSHAESDEVFATQLTRDLRASGALVWLDVYDAEPGRDWMPSVEQALEESQIMVVVLSPEALRSDHVTLEWQAYLEACRPVLPVLAVACQPPHLLSTRQPVNFTRNYSRALHHLMARLIDYNMRPQSVLPLDRARVHPASPVSNEYFQSDSAESNNGLRRMVLSLRSWTRR